MPKRKSDALPVPQNREEAAQVMRDFGMVQRRLEAIQINMNDEIAAIKEKTAKDATPVKDDLKQLEKRLKAWAEANKAELTRKTKTVDLVTGKISWRKKPESVRISGGADVMIERLKRLKLTSFLRTKFEVNKEAMLANKTAAGEVEGVSIISAGETFTIEPDFSALDPEDSSK